MIELKREVRGTAISVFGAGFDRLSPHGYSLGPDELWARTKDGTRFELTRDEIQQFEVEINDFYNGI